VICADKTGTLTEGIVHVQSACDVEGAPSDTVLLHAYLNAFYETGFANPIDKAIRAHRPFDLSGYQKEDEIPYDFIRKRLSILVSHDQAHLMVTKGALQNVLAVCRARSSNSLRNSAGRASARWASRTRRWARCPASAKTTKPA
jgi:Mg2+-importing ATPase